MRTGHGPREFALNPAHYGLPTRDDLVAMRIWDIHYHGLWEGDLRRHEETMFYVERMGIERVLSLDIAGSPGDPLGRSVPVEAQRTIRRFLEEPPHLAFRFGRDGAAQRVLGRTGDVERQHALDPHPLDVVQRLLVPANVALPQAMVVDVPDPHRDQVVAGRQAVRGRI